MRATIDSAGRLVIPKSMRDRLGLRQGPVDVEADGADLRVGPVAAERARAAAGTPDRDGGATAVEQQLPLVTRDRRAVGTYGHSASR